MHHIPHFLSFFQELKSPSPSEPSSSKLLVMNQPEGVYMIQVLRCFDEPRGRRSMSFEARLASDQVSPFFFPFFFRRRHLMYRQQSVR